MRSRRQALRLRNKVRPRSILRAFGNELIGRAVPILASGYIRLTNLTTRWQWEGRENLDAVIDGESPVIYAFWHSRILMMCPRMAESPLPIRVLISNNRDGEIIARIVQRFGHGTIRGSARNPKKSKDKGGQAAGLEMIRHLVRGGSGAITPDGPRGPRHVAQLGVSRLSAQSGLPIVPLAYSTKWGRELGSWDRFLLAMPFGRGAFVVGEPIIAPEPDDNSIEAHRLKVETTLNALTSRANEIVGRKNLP